MMKKLVLGVALSALVFQAQAADSRYSTWSDPNKPQVQSTANLDKMIKELRTMVDEAERVRAADPAFLRDLKGLADRYQGVAVSDTLLLSDDFSDGNYTANPTWSVTSGKYWVESGYGLRSFVEIGAAPAQAQPQQQKLSKEEAIIGILGAVLGGKVQRQEQSQTQTATTNSDTAEIYVAQPIKNAFSLKMELSSWKEGGHLELGAYQGSNRATGYRLIYRSSQNPALQLVRNYTSSSSVVDSIANLKLEDQKTHLLEWTRSTSGMMQISLDGKLLMQKSDMGFKDNFSGFVIENRGGDYIVKSIAVRG